MDEFICDFTVLETATEVQEIIDYGLFMMNIPDFWVHSKGEGVGVAVIDTGIDLNHPDLKPNIKLALDFTGSASGPQDVAGHGSHVAGIIGACQDGNGVIGVAPRCSLYSLKALGDDGNGKFEWIIEAMKWVLDNHEKYNIKIVNMSLGSRRDFPGDFEMLKRFKDAGIILVAAAGNDGKKFPRGMSTVGYPARHAVDKLCISVGAVDNMKHLADFSSNGGMHEVTIVGPGVNVMSCYPLNKWAKLSGTSMATPAIAGLLALMVSSHQERERAGNPSPTPLNNLDDAISHLIELSRDIGDDKKFGFGFPRFDNDLK